MASSFLFAGPIPDQSSAVGKTEVQAGVPPAAIVVGGSPTFPIHLQRQGVECSRGTFVYWDKAYLDDLLDQPYLPAALLVTRVISRPTGSTVCLDLSRRSVAAEKAVRQRVHSWMRPARRWCLRARSTSF